MPVYGDGLQVRDWLFVKDHCSGIRAVLERGKVGEPTTWAVANQRANIEVVKTVCALLDEFLPDSPNVPHSKLITYVQDRPGHDRRYAIDATKIETELRWSPRESFETGLRKTVQWCLSNQDWYTESQAATTENGLSRITRS